MTDQNPATEPAASAAAPGAASPTTPSPGTPRAKPRKPGNAVGPLTVALVIVVLLAVGLGWALWMQRQQFQTSGREIATRLDALEQSVALSRKESREALALAQGQTSRIAELQSQAQEAKTRYDDLQQAWQTFSGGASDELLANDIERLLVLANQQLRLAGNVNNAIVALETAQARLAQADRPRFASLQQSINGDLDRLRGVATIDIASQAGRIDRLAGLISKASMLVPDTVARAQAPAQNASPAPAAPPAVPDPKAALPADAAWWQVWRAEIASWPGRAGSALAHELGDLISIQRVDRPDALMLSAEQSEQVRAALRQRLMTAQLAMLMRQPQIWNNELDNVVQALRTYFDARSTDTQAALRLAEDLAQTDIAVRMPDLSDSLAGVAALRAAGFDATDKQD
ncbi:uroporphyrinogen-III C-methyltransferase [Bordetella genomosp. 7]|uniref:Heme biosynthesis operon protein HemX n=1 Tax=Bordetella genomosp. 7 TaxID=1416805 RepID=A0A261RK07_9BORD|nr:uroporphyrinogen-III C-methyltransferase [Bordetella genomosp. 7]OZI25117.1 heme biosynthesis operon protein HemX [Bordetella genomosp. 7]